MKTNRFIIWVAAMILSSASIVLGTTASYESVIEGDAPISFWPLNETNGTVIHDVVGTNNGTAINTSGLTLGGQGITYSNTPTDTAIYFSHSSSAYITVPYSANLNTSSFTLEVWLNMPASGSSYPENSMSFDCSCQQGWTWEVTSASTIQGWMGQNNGYGWGQLASWHA